MTLKSDLGSYRKNYKKNSTFNFMDIDNPLELFENWFQEFDNAGIDSEDYQ